MHRRVQVATTVAVVLAVLLLGVPLAVAGVVLQGAQARTSVQTRADAVLVAAGSRLQEGRAVDAALLRPYVRPGEAWAAQVVVELPDGDRVSAGDDPGRGAVEGVAASGDGLRVVVATPRWALLAADARLVVLVAGLAAGAVAAGSAVGLVQARRLVRPLEDLAERAERLGSGQVPADAGSSGVEEVDSVARALARSASRLQARLAAERDFASEAGHQLRTPLTALSMRLEEVQALTTDPAVAHEARVALEQVERLAGVVDDLLARARSRARPAVEAASAVALADVLVQQREEWAPVFARAGRRLEVDDAPAGPDGEPLRVLASPGPVAQALATLVENSLVHGGGTTRVAARRGGEWVVVEVADAGPGVPPELGARVFERRVSGAARTGIGLALARDLVVAEGGRLELARERPAVFAVFLPAAPPAPHEEEDRTA